jgi:methionyl-tRNA formyltransferase
MISKEKFRIVFMGTPEFAVESLKELLRSEFNIVGVVTSPDKPAGRGQKLNQSAIKTFAIQNNLPVLQPDKLKDEDFYNQLKQLNADLQIVVAFRMLPEKIWRMPRLGSINLHASLLPDYRGAAPINWAIINGEYRTGVTTFFLKHEIDTGDILYQEEILIEPNDNAGSVHDKLMQKGAQLLCKTVESIIENRYSEVPQNLIEAASLKYAPKIFKENCKINWSLPSISIHNMVRGLSPYPAAWAILLDDSNEEVPFKLFQTKVEKTVHDLLPGTLVSDGKTYLKVAAKDGFILIEEIQLSGKKRMQITEFIRGFKGIEKMKAV